MPRPLTFSRWAPPTYLFQVGTAHLPFPGGQLPTYLFQVGTAHLPLASGRRWAIAHLPSGGRALALTCGHKDTREAVVRGALFASPSPPTTDVCV